LAKVYSNVGMSLVFARSAEVDTPGTVKLRTPAMTKVSGVHIVVVVVSMLVDAGIHIVVVVVSLLVDAAFWQPYWHSSSEGQQVASAKVVE